MVLAGGKKSILAHLQANVNSGCVKPADYDSVIIFGGANGMENRKENQWEMGLKKLLTYVRDEMGIQYRYVVTLHGWYGWKDTRMRWADKDSGLPDDPSTPDDESKEKVWAKAWKQPKREKVMEWTLKYNNDIIAAEGTLITGVLRWSKAATATNETGSENIGEIIPGSRDWFRKPWASSDGLHPSEAGHKEIARRLRLMRIPGLR
jgi:lysophospholipase L1-like esterase